MKGATVDGFEDKIGLTSLGQIKAIIEAVSKESAKQERERIIKEFRKFIAKEACLMKNSVRMITVMDIERFIKDRIEKDQDG